MAKNKVKFNLSNVHFAPLVEADDGTISWDTPIPIPGAVSISLDPEGEPESFYADGIEYFIYILIDPVTISDFKQEFR